MSLGSLSPEGATDDLVRGALGSAAQVPQWGRDATATLAWCVEVGLRAPRAGGGRTRTLWDLLATVAAEDVAAARMLEPHLDALGILHEAGIDLSEKSGSGGLDLVAATENSSWGVFAAESADTRLDATHTGAGWVLRGTKPWCSLADHLSHALITAFVDDTQRQLFAVDLRARGVRPHRGEWHARGLPDVVSSPVDFDDVPAVPVGEAGWYLRRRGFAWGGMAVAACWWGAAQRHAQELAAAARSPRADQLAAMHLGRVDAALWAARAALAEAAGLVDGGLRPGLDPRLLSARVRAVTADAATLTLAEADAALGPAPLVADVAFARRAADLHLYLRQHHGLRDAARIGRLRVESS